MGAADWGFASDLGDVGGQIAIVGIGDADHSKASGRTTHEIAAQATERALADAGLTAKDIDGLMYVPFSRDQLDAIVETMELLANPRARKAITAHRRGRTRFFPLSTIDRDE